MNFCSGRCFFFLLNFHYILNLYTFLWLPVCTSLALDGLLTKQQWQEKFEEVVFYRQKGWLKRITRDWYCSLSICNHLGCSAIKYLKLHSILLYCVTNLDPMDLKSNHSAPVLTDPPPINKSRFGIRSNRLPYSPPGAAFSPGLLLTIPRKKTGVLDDVRSSSWLDAMKSSSPTHKKITKDFNTEPTSTDADAPYRTWLVNFAPFLSCSFSCLYLLEPYMADRLSSCTPSCDFSA